MGEELGWRGFLLPRIQNQKGAFKASLIIGVIHGFWHLPAYGFGVLPLTIFTTSMAFIVTAIYNKTNGSLLLPVLFHAATNAFASFTSITIPGLAGEMRWQLLILILPVPVAIALVWFAKRELFFENKKHNSFVGSDYETKPVF